MALFGLFKKCAICGSTKSASSLDSNGRCQSCASKARLGAFRMARNAAEEAKKPDPLDTAVRYILAPGNVRSGCPMVYRYPNVSVNSVNRDLLRKMVDAKDYSVDISVGESGEILLIKNGDVIAHLADRVKMCTDWLKKGRLLVCEFASFESGQEKVGLFFYRSEADEMKGNSYTVAKLTSCMSESKQETIEFLTEGEKLFVELDDNDKPYIRDIEYNPIGNLPAKFNRLYENDEVLGIYFDHNETLAPEDFNKIDKYIPFVRIYTPNA